MGALYPSPDQRTPHDPFDGNAGHRPDRHEIGDEQSGRRDARPRAFDVGEGHAAGRVGERKPVSPEGYRLARRPRAPEEDRQGSFDKDRKTYLVASTPLPNAAIYIFASDLPMPAIQLSTSCSN
jgi:hypothetical protein